MILRFDDSAPRSWFRTTIENEAPPASASALVASESAGEVIAILRAENAALRAENLALHARLAELEQRLGLNSSNSGKPPSSDGLKKASRSEAWADMLATRGAGAYHRLLARRFGYLRRDDTHSKGREGPP